MKKLNQAIDRFCILHPNFGIPNLMLYVVIGNVVLGLLSNFSNGSFLSFFSYTLSGLLHGQVWRLVTFVLIPESTSPFYLLITCYFYYWIGSTLERQWGTAKFTTYYLSGMLLTVVGAFQFRKNRFEPDERRGIYLPVLFPFYPFGSIEEKRRVTIYTCIGACRFLENKDSGISGYHRTGDNSREYGRERQDGKAISYDDSGRGRSV